MRNPLASLGSGPGILPFRAAFAAVAVVGLVSCGSGGSTPSSTAAPPAATTQVEVNLGDAPADQVVACAMTLDSMALAPSAGGSVSLLGAPATVEMTRLMGAMQPMGMIPVPQGTYSGVSVVLGSAVISYLDPASHALVQKTVPGPMTAAFTFPSPMTVGATPMTLNLDMDLGASIAMDGSGNMTLTPTFRAAAGGMGPGNPMDPAQGGMPHLAGSVVAVSASGFTMATMMGAQTLSFQTNAATAFQGGLSGLGLMTHGMLVRVDATLQTDGSLLATVVQELEGPGGAMAGGLISAITGQPPASLTLVMQDGMGGGMMPSGLANTVTLNLAPTTTYAIDPGMIDLSGLPFTPVFDAAHLYVGQCVSAESGSGLMAGSGMMGSGGMMAGTLDAAKVELEPQGFSGTVSNLVASGTTATFTLTLPAGSAFTTLTGATSLTVFQQSATELVGMTTVANGDALHVRGLLFFDGGSWKLVAGRMMMP